ncbi:MAG TPA: nuclear transport factor 2 family protein [Steroidobacteraceae bacterium]|nr:nuclear transport factor 2 family protein [Steroidobacteraceae bacterium]
MSQLDITALVRSSYEAYVKKDRALIETLLAPDFHFTSPLDNRLDRETYFKRCWPNSENMGKFEFIHVVQDGNKVFVTYEGSSKAGHRFRNTEIATLRDRQIIEVEVYFGWSIPHEAPPGGFIDHEKTKTEHP